MLVLELISSQRHPPRPKELGEKEVKLNKKDIRIDVYDVCACARVRARVCVRACACVCVCIYIYIYIYI